MKEGVQYEKTNHGLILLSNFDVELMYATSRLNREYVLLLGQEGLPKYTDPLALA